MIASLAALAPATLRADETPTAPVAPVSSVPLSPTSQCVEGPGAPPADPTKITRVTVATEPPSEPAIDEPPGPDRPAPVLLELGVAAGASVRFDEGPYLNTTRRAGFAFGGSVFVWPNRVLSFGLDYAHVDLDRVESARDSVDIVLVDHAAHTLMADARFVPFRASVVALYVTIGAGFAWQTASTNATFPPRDGFPGGSFHCSTSAGADFAFRAGLGLKARLGHAGAAMLGADFVGYRLSSDLLDSCAYGAGAAQTLMIRGGFAYDLDISRLVR